MLEFFIGFILFISGIYWLVSSRTGPGKPTPFELQQAASEKQREAIMQNYYLKEKEKAAIRYEKQENKIRLEMYLNSLSESARYRLLKQYGNKEAIPIDLYKHIQTPNEIIEERAYYTSLLENAADHSEERKMRDELKKSQEMQKSLQQGLATTQKTLRDVEKRLRDVQYRG